MHLREHHDRRWRLTHRLDRRRSRCGSGCRRRLIALGRRGHAQCQQQAAGRHEHDREAPQTSIGCHRDFSCGRNCGMHASGAAPRVNPTATTPCRARSAFTVRAAIFTSGAADPCDGRARSAMQHDNALSGGHRRGGSHRWIERWHLPLPRCRDSASRYRTISVCPRTASARGVAALEDQAADDARQCGRLAEVRQPPGLRSQPLPAAARLQSGELVPVGRRRPSPRRSARTSRSFSPSATRRATGAT